MAKEQRRPPKEQETPHGGAVRVSALRRHTRTLCLAAFLAALSFLLGVIAKTIQGAGPLRLTVEGLPIVFAGMAMGPLIGAIVGASADLLSCLLSGQAPLPLITVGAASIGIVAGLLTMLLRRGERPLARRFGFFSLLLIDGAAHAVGSMLIKSLALSSFYGFNPLLFRVLIYLVVIALESYLLYIILRSDAVRRELEKAVGK